MAGAAVGGRLSALRRARPLWQLLHPADGVLGAVALPAVAVCAVKRTNGGSPTPAGTVPY